MGAGDSASPAAGHASGQISRNNNNNLTYYEGLVVAGRAPGERDGNLALIVNMIVVVPKCSSFTCSPVLVRAEPSGR